MDILGGLTAFGAYLNNKEVPVISTDYDTAIQRTVINGQNIYNNTNYRNNKNYMADIAYQRYQQALNPRDTGIIPNFYNQFKDVEARNAANNKIIYDQQQKTKELILQQQFKDIDNRNLKYKQIFIYGLVPFILMMIFIYLTV